jgi:8-oxo-dGTP pyrophosphatase MutT (NUDIX family)
MNQNKYGWKTLSSRIAYKNPWISVRHDRIAYPGGRKGIYGVVQKGPGVAVVAVNDAGRIYLVKQYRYTLDDVFFELPAGAIHQGESSLASAKRELWEEIGLKADKWKRLGNFYTALGHENAEIIVYLAEGLKHSKTTSLNQQHDETLLEIAELSPVEVKKMIRSNKLNCGITLAALNLYFLS